MDYSHPELADRLAADYVAGTLGTSLFADGAVTGAKLAAGAAVSVHSAHVDDNHSFRAKLHGVKYFGLGLHIPHALRYQRSKTHATLIDRFPAAHHGKHSRSYSPPKRNCASCRARNFAPD